MRKTTWFLMVVGWLCLVGSVAEGGTWMENQWNGFVNAERKALDTLADPEAVARAPDDKLQWLRLAEYIWRYVDFTGRAWPEQTERALDNVLARVEKAFAAEPDDRDRQFARTYALMAKYRYQQIRGDRTFHPAWVEAATWLGQPDHIATELRYGMRAAVSLAEASVGKKADVQALEAQSRALLDAVLAETSGDEPKAVREAQWHTALAKACLLRKDKGGAKKHVAAGLKALAPFLAKPSDDLAKAHEDLAIVSHRAKLRVKAAAFRTQTRSHGASGLRLTVPHSPRWVFQPIKNREAFRLIRLTGDGGRYFQFVVSAYPRDVRLTYPTGVTVGVADTKASAAVAADDPEAQFRVVDHDEKVPVKKGKLGRDFKDVYTFVVDGHHVKDKRRMRVLGWWARNKKTDYIVSVTVFHDLGEPLGDDMLPWLLSNLEIMKKK